MHRSALLMILSIMMGTILLFTAGIANAATTNSNMATSKSFLEKAANINLAEVRLGTLAESSGKSNLVQRFGELLQLDHANAQKQLKAVASSEHIAIPSKPDKDSMAYVNKLSGMSGSAFDQDFMTHMLAGHQGAVSLYEQEIEYGHNDAIRSYAEKTLPVIQDHLRIAEHIAGELKISGKDGLSNRDKYFTETTLMTGKPEK